MESRAPSEGLGWGEARSPRAAVLASLLCAALCAALFALLTWNAVADTGLARIDPEVQDFVVRHRVGWLTDALRVLTWLGAAPVLALVVVAIGAVVVWRRRAWLDWSLLAVAWLLAVGAKDLGKELVGRPRPPASLAVGSSTGFAFPSGHAADSLAVFAMGALILSVGLDRRMALTVWAGAAAVVLVVGASRVYLGEHWLTDVLGGWALAGAITSMVSVPLWLSHRRRPRTAERIRPPGGPART